MKSTNGFPKVEIRPIKEYRVKFPFKFHFFSCSNTKEAIRAKSSGVDEHTNFFFQADRGLVLDVPVTNQGSSFSELRPSIRIEPPPWPGFLFYFFFFLTEFQEGTKAKVVRTVEQSNRPRVGRFRGPSSFEQNSLFDVYPVETCSYGGYLQDCVRQD